MSRGTASSFAVLCVLAAAGAALAGDAASPPSGGDAVIDISGRWEGRSYELARTKDCAEKPCTLTLDVARCAAGWCGVEVLDAGRKCGSTALKLDAGERSAISGNTLFKGKLELAQGTEPYVVEVSLINWSGDEPKTQLHITGDTGGEFRMFRRTFPFNATLARSGDAHCRPESTVSLLD
ncbi:hypothetical protein [Hyphomicrobium zavarzinii]|uniref:hypothetical protein n=1 Tax=Hyphomicrobium zavarzinii TaxID=48292 RepID=UPI0012ECB128|nr:hypothetical protein [Hyphomicrobium zavarzinii]